MGYKNKEDVVQGTITVQDLLDTTEMLDKVDRECSEQKSKAARGLFKPKSFDRSKLPRSSRI